MKIIKIMICVLSIVWGISANATEGSISLKGKEIFGYNQPYYHFDDAQYGWRDRYNIVALVNPNNFPVSSYEQGSVFTKIFDDLAKKEHIVISFYYPRDYQTSIEKFEKKMALGASSPLNIKPAKRDIKNLSDELLNIKEVSKHTYFRKNFEFDKVVITKKDRIFPYSSQSNFWARHANKLELECGHFPFFEFKDFDAILEV